MVTGCFVTPHSVFVWTTRSEEVNIKWRPALKRRAMRAGEWIRKMPAYSQRLKSRYFGFYLGIASLVRLYLVHDVVFPLLNRPHDGSLYVSRAFYLVTAGTLGPYDGRLFVKDPGISFVMAISRWLGFDYLSFIGLLHILAAVYLATGLVRIGFNRVSSGIIFAVALFAPVTASTTWFNFDRENIDTILNLFFFSALTFGLANWRRNVASPLDIFVLCAAGAASFFMREENLLLLALIAGLFGIEILRWWRARRAFSLSPIKNGTVRACALMLVTIALFKISLMSFYFLRYNTFVMNDFNSGSYPAFVGALRSVSGDSQRPYVSITLEGMRKAAKQIPYLQKLVDNMPLLPKPGDAMYPIYQHYGVFDEFPNSHIMFWIKDAAVRAGLTPNASAAQEFFRKAALDIENACSTGALACTSQPATLVPLVKLAWLPNIRFGLLDGLRNFVYLPELNAMRDEPPPINADWLEALRLGRMYQFLAKVPFDSLGLTAAKLHDDGQSIEDHSVDYWCRYQDIAVAKGFGVLRSLSTEFYRPFSHSLGMGDGIIDSTTLEDPKYASRLKEFASANVPPGCWKNDAQPVVAAALYFLRQKRGQIGGFLKAPSGAYDHFIKFGEREGRIFYQPVIFFANGRTIASSVIRYNSVSYRIRQLIVSRLWAINAFVFLLAAIAFVFSSRRAKTNPLTWPLALILCYGAVKLTALSYIGIVMGPVDSRLYLSLNYMMTIFGLAYFVYFLLGRFKFPQQVAHFSANAGSSSGRSSVATSDQHLGNGL